MTKHYYSETELMPYKDDLISIPIKDKNISILESQLQVVLQENEEKSSFKSWIAIKSNCCYFLSNVYNFSQQTVSLLIRAVAKCFANLIAIKESRTVLNSIFNVLNTPMLVKLIKDINMIEVCISSNYSALIEIMDDILRLNNKEADEALLSCFNTKEKWEELAMNRQGKYIAEYLMTTYFYKEPSKLSLLFEVIEVNFLEYSKTNFTTFLVQCYIQTYKSSSIVSIILKSMISLISCRNGVFVLISALKTYKDDILYLLIDRVIELSDIFSKDAYASTVIEYLFKNHTEYSTRKFIQTKKDSFQGKHYL